MPDQNEREPLHLLKILGAAFSGVLFGWLLSRSAPIQNAAESVHPEDTPAEESECSQVQSAIVSKISPSPRKTEQPDRREDRTPRWKKIAERTIAGATAGLLLVNIFVMYWNRKAAKAAETAADTAQRQLELSQRPWVVTEYAVSAPIEYTPDGGVKFEITGTYKNIGNSVALDVLDIPLPHIDDITLALTHPTNEQKEVCERMRNMREKSQESTEGDTLFPQDRGGYKMPIHFTKEQLDHASIGGQSEKIIGFVIIGCVDYKFSFSPKHHQTGYFYEIVRPLPNGQPGSIPMKLGETLQPNQLIIRRSLLGGFYAD